MKTNTTYSTQYHVHFAWGGSMTASISADTLKELMESMNKFADRAKKHGDQAITFEPITKTVSSKIEVKGHFAQFVDKLKNGVCYGGLQVDQEFYKPLKRH